MIFVPVQASDVLSSGLWLWICHIIIPTTFILALTPIRDIHFQQEGLRGSQENIFLITKEQVGLHPKNLSHLSPEKEANTPLSSFHVF